MRGWGKGQQKLMSEITATEKEGMEKMVKENWITGKLGNEK